MKGILARSLLLAAAIAAVLGVLHLLGVGLPLLYLVAATIAFIGLTLPLTGVRLLDDIVAWVRNHFWAAQQGHFHAFGGVPLQIDDDGRHVWVDGAGYMRALGRSEPEDALAARHAGRWQRTERGVLMLRVDAVVQNLATMPGRDDPRVQRLRRYFEREVLFPADQRRQRG